LVKKEVDRIEKDFSEYEKQDPVPYYQLNIDKLDEIENFCKKIITLDAEGSYNTQIKVLKKKIIDLARKSPITEFGIAHKELQKWGGKHRPLKLGELIVNFAKQDPAALISRNPSLTIADITTLYENISLYLQLGIQQQQARRSLKTLNKLKNKVDKAAVR